MEFVAQLLTYLELFPIKKNFLPPGGVSASTRRAPNRYSQKVSGTFFTRAYVSDCIVLMLCAPPVPLTEMEVMIVVKSKAEVHPGVAEAWALIWADTVHAAVVLFVRAAAGDHASPPEVVQQGGPRRTVQPNLSFMELLYQVGIVVVFTVTSVTAIKPSKSCCGAKGGRWVRGKYVAVVVNAVSYEINRTKILRKGVGPKEAKYNYT